MCSLILLAVGSQSHRKPVKCVHSALSLQTDAAARQKRQIEKQFDFSEECYCNSRGDSHNTLIIGSKSESTRHANLQGCLLAIRDDGIREALQGFRQGVAASCDHEQTGPVPAARLAASSPVGPVQFY
jgi:hypothetical protein